MLPSVQNSTCISGVSNNVCFSPYQHMLGSFALQEALKAEIASNTSVGKRLEQLVKHRQVFFALGSAGVADSGAAICDESGQICGVSHGYEHNNNGRCYQIRLNTTGADWQWGGAPKDVDIILQSINIGLSNAFDIYMAQGGAGAFASNTASGRHGTCSQMWGNVPGFDLQKCLSACAGDAGCEQYCQLAVCPAGPGATYEDCSAKCGFFSGPMCREKCRIFCPPAGHAAADTWPSDFSNFWQSHLQDSPLCKSIPSDDAELLARVNDWFSFVNPAFPNASDAKANLIQSAFMAVKYRFGCTNPQGTWQEITCPHALTEVSGLRRIDERATAFCNGTSTTDCNPNLQLLTTSRRARLQWGTHEYGGSGPKWMQKTVLRTDAQITQMMDCRSPDSSQCFNLPSEARWAPGREAAWNVDVDGTLITTPGHRGCANTPDYDWSEVMNGPLPYVAGNCPIAFPPTEDSCTRYQDSDICGDMKFGPNCWPGSGSPQVSSFNASNPDCWYQEPGKHYCPTPKTANESDIYGECTPGSGLHCCSGLQCIQRDAYYSECCIGRNHPEGCGSFIGSSPSFPLLARPLPLPPMLESDNYCPDPLPSDKADVFGDCTPGKGKTCCSSLQCLKVDNDFSQCCLQLDNPKGCGLSARPNATSGCGQQTVSKATGYRTNKLGQTLPAAMDTCSVTLHDGYNDPAQCNRKPTTQKICNGTAKEPPYKPLHMVEVHYPQYNRSQYECKQER